MSNIKHLIFDFGDIFIDLDKTASLREMLSISPGFFLDEETDAVNKAYEKGALSTSEFVQHYHERLPEIDPDTLKYIWNAIILDFPEHRLEFLRELRENGRYTLTLLSNTNALHMEKVVQNMGRSRFETFRSCFDRFYLSHEIGMRKPDREIFEFVLRESGTPAGQCLFIDDMPENTEGAAQLGIHTWNLVPGKEDVTQLFLKDFPL